jgi:hypothetical protein
MPMLAALRAGASFTPSPVIATISPFLLSAFMIFNFALAPLWQNINLLYHCGKFIITHFHQFISSNIFTVIVKPNLLAIFMAVTG